jgi:hypothetical protein
LRPATRQRGTADSITFLGLDENDGITKAHC